MSLIDVRNLTFSYDGNSNAVFENVSFQIDTDWKLGFVGRNGRGKTTFLNLLMGKYEYGGKISSNVKFFYFPFEVKEKSRLALEIIREICEAAEDWEIIRELSFLQADADILYRPFENLSGGEQTKLLLAGLFLNRDSFFLIDEPTNHLDTSGRKTVSEYLRRKKGFILVSHDRAFLDGCVDHILSINRTNIEVQSGNFSSRLENFERQQSYEASQNERLKKDIKRLSEAASRTAAWSEKTEASKYGKADSGLKQDKGYVGHKAAKLMKKAKVTEARQQEAIRQKSELLKNSEAGERLKLFPLIYRSERLFSVSDAEIVYGGRKICLPVNFQLLRGDRVALDGGNGSGKSSFLKIFVGEKIKHTGEISLGSGLIVSYVPQTAEHLKGNLFDFAKENNLDESLFMAILSKMDLTKKEFEGDISRYSEGQKKKVMLAKSLCERAHVYIWDEPLNYIDIYSRLQIEELLKEFQPTMIFVEHDKAFRDAVATKTVELIKT